MIFERVDSTHALKHHDIDNHDIGRTPLNFLAERSCSLEFQMAVSLL